MCTVDLFHLEHCIVKSKLLKKGCVVTRRFVYFSISYVVNIV